jgi:hypothetical protein
MKGWRSFYLVYGPGEEKDACLVLGLKGVGLSLNPLESTLTQFCIIQSFAPRNREAGSQGSPKDTCTGQEAPAQNPPMQQTR